jgi:hypothetical protein
MRRRKTFVLAAAAIVAAGCRAGPKYGKPVTPAPIRYKETTPPGYRGVLAGTWRPANPSEALPKGRWWEIYHEPELNALEERLRAAERAEALSRPAGERSRTVGEAP